MCFVSTLSVYFLNAQIACLCHCFGTTFATASTCGAVTNRISGSNQFGGSGYLQNGQSGVRLCQELRNTFGDGVYLWN